MDMMRYLLATSMGMYAIFIGYATWRTDRRLKAQIDELKERFEQNEEEIRGFTAPIEGHAETPWSHSGHTSHNGRNRRWLRSIDNLDSEGR